MFWVVLGVLGVLMAAISYMAAGAALATAWGMGYGITEKRWGTARACGAGMGVVWVLVVGALWWMTKDVMLTAIFAAVMGVIYWLFTPRD